MLLRGSAARNALTVPAGGDIVAPGHGTMRLRRFTPSRMGHTVNGDSRGLSPELGDPSCGSLGSIEVRHDAPQLDEVIFAG